MKEYLSRMYSDTKEKYYNYLFDLIKKSKKKFVITANPEFIMLAQNDKEVSKMLLDKNVSVTPDGIGVVKAANMLDINILERVTGVDISEKLLDFANNNKKSLYIFGSKQEVLDNMDFVLKEKYPNIKVLGLTNGYVEDRDLIFDQIKKLSPDICLVALGMPHQEKLIYKHIKDFKKGIFIGVGGSIDVLSGSKKRAPKLFIKTNTEWLYRIVCEPSRFKRFWNNNVKFMFAAKRERKKYK